MTKEVRFDIYCEKCKFASSSPSSDPCNECLGDPCNEGSHVPRLFKKEKSFINYRLPDPDVECYTRDHLKSEMWADHEPTETELNQYFTKKDNGDWYEKEV